MRTTLTTRQSAKLDAEVKSAKFTEGVIPVILPNGNSMQVPGFTYRGLASYEGAKRWCLLHIASNLAVCNPETYDDAKYFAVRLSTLGDFRQGALVIADWPNRSHVVDCVRALLDHGRYAKFPKENAG